MRSPFFTTGLCLDDETRRLGRNALPASSHYRGDCGRSPEWLRPDANGNRRSGRGPEAHSHGGAGPQDGRADHSPTQWDHQGSPRGNHSARVKGFLKEVHFSEGSNVKAGDLLLVIEEDPFQVKVEQAKAVLEEARAELEKAKESRAKEVAQARVSLDDAQLQLDRVEERRERNLLARKAASQDDYDQAKVKVDKSRGPARGGQGEPAANDGRLQNQHPLSPGKDRPGQGRSRRRPYRSRLLSDVRTDRRPHRRTEGEAAATSSVPAASTSDTTSLVSIQQLHPMGLDLRPASRFLPIITRLVKKGLEVKLRIGGQKIHPHTGTIKFVDNTVDPTTSTVLVRAEVPNPDETMLPGEYVKVEINIGDYADAIVIPDAAVVEAQEGSRVLVVDDQNKVQLAVVKPLDVYQGLAVIESGLNEGQNVIVKGVQLVRPGQTVKTEETATGKLRQA